MTIIRDITNHPFFTRSLLLFIVLATASIQCMSLARYDTGLSILSVTETEEYVSLFAFLLTFASIVIVTFGITARQDFVQSKDKGQQAHCLSDKYIVTSLWIFVPLIALQLSVMSRIVAPTHTPIKPSLSGITLGKAIEGMNLKKEEEFVLLGNQLSFRHNSLNNNQAGIKFTTTDEDANPKTTTLAGIMPTSKKVFAITTIAYKSSDGDNPPLFNAVVDSFSKLYGNPLLEVSLPLGVTNLYISAKTELDSKSWRSKDGRFLRVTDHRDYVKISLSDSALTEEYYSEKAAIEHQQALALEAEKESKSESASSYNNEIIGTINMP